ncbi:MAG: DUF1707 domain-containing protein [Propionibacteriaceae bacterium]|jgi:hypothetical protein|nr:DUF1707 domain-containing protein [Propionibacteriaceae bacterium]
MSELEPRDVGPRVGGDLPVTPTDRGLVANVLDAALREGRLDAEEHRRRSSLAATALTFDDLIPLTRDLQPAGVANPAQALAAYAQGAVPATPAAPAAAEQLNLVGVFSGFERKGPWVAPAQMSALTVFGGGELDLRDAQWTSPVIEVNVTAVCGGLEIKVPAGTEVVNQVTSIFGGASVKGQAGLGAGRRLVIKGLCLCGGVSVKVK